MATISTLSYDTLETWQDDDAYEPKYYLRLKFGDFEVYRWEVDWNMLNHYNDDDREQYIATKLRKLFEPHGHVVLEPEG